MKLLLRSALAILVAVSCSVNAGNVDNITLVIGISSCAVNYPELKETPFGKSVLSIKEIREIMTPEVRSCLKRNVEIERETCELVFSQDPSGPAITSEVIAQIGNTPNVFEFGSLCMAKSMNK